MGIQLLGKTNINFVGLRKYAFLLSAILVTLGMIAMVQMFRGQANLGIDFAGGTAVQLKFERPFKLDKARHALDVHGVKDSELQQFTEGNKLLIQIKKATHIPTEKQPIRSSRFSAKSSPTINSPWRALRRSAPRSAKTCRMTPSSR